MLENIGIRTKVLGVVIITATIGTVAAANLSTLGTDRAVRSVTASLPDLGTATTALRAERDLSLVASGPSSGAPADAALARAREVSAPVLTEVRRSLDDVDTAALPAAAASAVTAASTTPLEIAQVRQQVDAGDLPAVQVRAAYDAAIGAVQRVPSAVALSQSDRDLSLELSGWVQGHEVMTLTDAEVERIVDSLEGDPLDAVQSESLYALAVRRDVLRAAFVSDIGATGVSVPATADALSQVRALLLNATTAAAIAASPSGAPEGVVPARLDAETVRAAARDEQALLARATDELASGAQARAGQIVAQSQRDLVSRVSIVAALVALVLGLALVVSDGIVRRLRRVTVAADAMREQLPAAVAAASAAPGVAPQRTGSPVPVTAGASGSPAIASVGDVAGRGHGRDEVGRLASALDDVGALALDLAAGQARLRASVSDAFVSVARRNQSLLDRQLGAIDVLEQDETDAAALEKLFELDHTTARMRRNAESLLVIAGVEGGRRARSPMALVDVVRTAASGVEHYERVEVSLDGEPQVLPHAALPLSHLVAELLDNATSFSSPTSPVTVSAGARDGGVRLTIEDRGVGMDAGELARARARLADTSHAALVDASRLGLTVVARLARRLAVDVHLSSRAEPGPDRGTVVHVQVPVSLFADGTAPAQPAQVKPAQVRPAQVKPAQVKPAQTVATAAQTVPARPTTVRPTTVRPAREVFDATDPVAPAREASAPDLVDHPSPPRVVDEPADEPSTRRAARHRVERRRWWSRRPQHARPDPAQAPGSAQRSPAPEASPSAPPAPTGGAGQRTTTADAHHGPAASSAAPSSAAQHEPAVGPPAPSTLSRLQDDPEPVAAAPSAAAAPVASTALPAEGPGYRPVRGGGQSSGRDGAEGTEPAKPLPRRTPRSRTPAPAPAPAPPSRAEAAAAATANGSDRGAARAPDQVRSTLAGFRAGVERARAQSSTPAAASTPARPAVIDLRDAGTGEPEPSPADDAHDDLQDGAHDGLHDGAHDRTSDDDRARAGAR